MPAGMTPRHRRYLAVHSTRKRDRGLQQGGWPSDLGSPPEERRLLAPTDTGCTPPGQTAAGQKRWTTLKPSLTDPQTHCYCSKILRTCKAETYHCCPIRFLCQREAYINNPQSCVTIENPDLVHRGPNGLLHTRVCTMIAVTFTYVPKRNLEALKERIDKKKHRFINRIILCFNKDSAYSGPILEFVAVK